MNKISFIILFYFIFALFTQQAHGAPMIYRVQQMQAMKKRQAQEEYEAEYQQYQQNGQGSQSQSQQLSPQETYQQSVDERNQSIAQAIVKANGQSVSVADVPATGSAPSSGGQNLGMMQQSSGFGNSSQSAGDTVDLTEVWKKLDNKSVIWTALDDDQAKVMTVSEYIGRYQKEGVKINEPPQHYVQMIDQMSQQNPQMLQQPFGQLIQTMAIIDYDFDNGMDKDMLAKKLLGDQGYAANQQRIQQEQQAAQQQASQQQGSQQGNHY